MQFMAKLEKRRKKQQKRGALSANLRILRKRLTGRLDNASTHAHAGDSSGSANGDVDAVGTEVFGDHSARLDYAHGDACSAEG